MTAVRGVLALVPRRRRRRRTNASRSQLGRVMKEFARTTPKNTLVLDAGAGTSPYRHLFKHARYEASDFAQLGTTYAPLDYVCDMTAIPVKDGRFGAVVCNQVLEHLPAPDLALAELFRVLAPGGRILLSAPLFYAEHQRPYDFFRYTQFGLRKLFDEAGFQVQSVDWLEGYYGTVSYQLHEMTRRLPKDLATVRAWNPGRRGLQVALVLFVTRRLAKALEQFYARLDLEWKYTVGMPKNYVVLARKPKLA